MGVTTASTRIDRLTQGTNSEKINKRSLHQRANYSVFWVLKVKWKLLDIKMLLHSFTLFVIPILYMPQDGKHGERVPSLWTTAKLIAGEGGEPIFTSAKTKDPHLTYQSLKWAPSCTRLDHLTIAGYNEDIHQTQEGSEETCVCIWEHVGRHTHTHTHSPGGSDRIRE